MNRLPRILAVDDDPMNRIVVMEYLDDDYDLVVVGSGEEALDTIPRFRPDVILLDIMMPGLDGYETCRRVKSDPHSRHTKVILVSAKAMLEERLEGYEAGADDYVTKPFSGDELRAKLDVYLRLRSVEEVDDLKGQFLALLAHETRTPLTAIACPANLLQMELADRPDLLELAGTILGGAQRLETMIDRALRLCEYKAGRVPLNLEAVDLGELVDRCLDEEAERIESKRIRVVRTSTSDLTVEGDPEELHLVVRSLLKHTIGDLDAEGTLEVDWLATADTVEMQIRDDGSAGDENWTPYLFEDFYVPSLENHTGSLELELALAGAVVREHGGAISARVDASGNQVFDVRLPRVVDRERSVTADRRPAPSPVLT